MTRTTPFALALVLGLIGCGQVAGPAIIPEETGAQAASKTYGLTAIRAIGKHKGDYLPAHNFKLEIDGVIVGGFKEISGLESETERRAGAVKYKNIVLKRGFIADPSLTEWLGAGAKAERKSGSVIYCDSATDKSVRYNFFEAWPTRVATKDVGFDVLIAEALELTVERVELAPPGDQSAVTNTQKSKHDAAMPAIQNTR